MKSIKNTFISLLIIILLLENLSSIALATNYEKKEIKGDADITFVIDTTGSMDGYISNLKQNINDFVDTLTNDFNINLSLSLVSFKDIQADGEESTQIIKNENENWFYDVSNFKNKLHDLTLDGGGDEEETSIDALEVARQLDYRNSAQKFIILFTDAGYKINNRFGITSMNEMVQKLKKENFHVSVVTTDFEREEYSSLYEETGGIFANISENFKTDLIKIANSIGEQVKEFEKNYINEHLSFIESEDYKQLLEYNDIINNFKLKSFEECKNAFSIWKAARFDIFENPYDIVLANVILSNQSSEKQLEIFENIFDSDLRTVIDSFIEIINDNGKIDLEIDERSKIEKLLSVEDYSDQEIYKLLESKLKNVDKKYLDAFFTSYDKSGQVLELFNKGKNLVDSVKECINYIAILNAYKNTSEEFKQVLAITIYECDDPFLYETIMSYIKLDDDEIERRIVEKICEKGINVGLDFFKEELENGVKKFLVNNMDISNIPPETLEAAGGISSFLAGCKKGYDIGVILDNWLFNTDEIADSYVLTYATINFGKCLKNSLESLENNLRKEKSYFSAKVFCTAFNMYKNVQIDVVDKIVSYYSSYMKATISRLFDDDIASEVAIYNWLIYKIAWQESYCHAENDRRDNINYSLIKKKIIENLCPTDVLITDEDGNSVLEIVNNKIISKDRYISAIVINNGKYMVLPDNQNYNISIKAKEDGQMTYSVAEYNNKNKLENISLYNNIKIEKDNEYSGKIEKNINNAIEDYELVNGEKNISCEKKYLTNEEIISINSIEFEQKDIYLKKDEKKQLKVNIFPENASIKNLVWYSSDEEVVKVDEYGNITAINSGSATITCKTLSNNISDICNIKVILIGDLDENDKINSFDALKILQISSRGNITEEEKKVADINEDGKVNSLDALKVLQYATGKIDKLE